VQKREQDITLEGPIIMGKANEIAQAMGIEDFKATSGSVPGALSGLDLLQTWVFGSPRIVHLGDTNHVGSSKVVLFGQ